VPHRPLRRRPKGWARCLRRPIRVWRRRHWLRPPPKSSENTRWATWGAAPATRLVCVRLFGFTSKVFENAVPLSCLATTWWPCWNDYPLPHPRRRRRAGMPKRSPFCASSPSLGTSRLTSISVPPFLALRSLNMRCGDALDSRPRYLTSGATRSSLIGRTFS
jgi:hypothetical protein